MRKQSWFGLAAAAAIVMVGGAAVADGPVVVVSIKPIHSLVAAIMRGIGDPVLLVDGAASPHSFVLKPSHAAALEEADLVIRVGGAVDAFLERSLAAIAPDAAAIELIDDENLAILGVRTDAVWEPHADDHDDEALAAGHGSIDSHVWLDPVNAGHIARRVTETLATLDPTHALAYRENLARLEPRLAMLDGALARALAPIRNEPFIVFHDAFQYLEKRYGLRAVGSVAIDPERSPGAKRLQALRDRIDQQDIRCVFGESSIAPSLVETMIEGTPVRFGVLDPEGTSLSAGPEMYFSLMRAIGDGLTDCLAAGS